MIKSSKTTIKFANKQKREAVLSFLLEYKNTVSQIIDLIWGLPKIPTLLPAIITNQLKDKTWLSARAIQCAGKQASAIVRGTKKKQEQRQYRIQKLIEENKLVQAGKLQKIFNKNIASKPNISTIEPELDARFVKIDFETKTKFVDGWVTLGSIGNKQKVIIPFRKTKHLNEMLRKGKILGGIKLSKSNITFNIEIPDVEKKTQGKTIGIDIGKSTLLSISDGTSSKKNKHNHDLNSILQAMSRKKKGSKAFKRAEAHRTNYINWSVHQLNLENIKEVKLEKIRNLRVGKCSSRMLSHWNYAEIFDKLNSKCESLGVQVIHVSPTYTSQRCFACGWTQKTNRKGKQFKCKKCFYEADSDLNAAKNISLNFLPIGKKERLLQRNRNGFYFYEVGQEPIVPVVR